MWIVVIVVVAVIFAAKAGVPAAGRAIGNAWRNRGQLKQRAAAKRRLAVDAANSGMAPNATLAGETMGDAAAAVISGARLTWTAFREAWKNGWREGTGRAEARRDNEPYVPPKAKESTAVDDNGEDEPTGSGPSGGERGCLGEIWLSETNSSAPCPFLPEPYCQGHLDEIAAEAQEPDREKQAPTTEGTNVMPIETTTGGEVLTKDQFEKEMEALKAEQLTELEDAQNARKNALENNGRIELMAASMAGMEVSAAVVAQVRLMADTTAAVTRNAEERQSLAEARIAQADKTLTELRGSRQTAFFTS